MSTFTRILVAGVVSVLCLGAVPAPSNASTVTTSMVGCCR